jgi:putative addiction module killer protein
MNEIRSTKLFKTWLSNLKDSKARGRILFRIAGAEAGNFGDSKSVGAGVLEMRIHCGPGYRIYYTRTGPVIYLLLCGGDKETQKQDIERAISMAEDLKEKSRGK